MSIILYANGKCEVSKRLQQSIERTAPEQQTEIFRTIESFTGRFRQGKSYGAIVVLLAINQKELFDLVSIRNLLSDVRIILILPDRKMETISIGHSLYPRYLTYVDSDFTDASAVLKKMLEIVNLENITKKRRWMRWQNDLTKWIRRLR